MPPIDSKVHYNEYLKLDKILSAQEPVSDSLGKPAHDELLFIVVHQVYELWFKQILFELDEIIKSFSQNYIQEGYLAKAHARLVRINRIFETINTHFNVLETMTPMDFLEFRNLLTPASGFQSVQFKKMEAKLGLKREWRQKIDREFFFKSLSKSAQEEILNTEKDDGLLQLLDSWLSRMPFLEFSPFNFWNYYKDAVEQLFEDDKKIIEAAHVDEEKKKMEFQALNSMKENILTFLDPEKFAEYKKQGGIRLSQKACMAALFINLNREEPLLQGPFQFLNSLMDLEENLGNWRYRHKTMVQRMLGAKIGTGGSAGADFLKSTIENNRIFGDLFKLSSFYIPRSSLPELPKSVKDELGFTFSFNGQ